MELQIIQNKIYEILGLRVMIDFDLAEIYETETKRLKESDRRNLNRFPPDFILELNELDYQFLRTQFATLERSGRENTVNIYHLPLLNKVLPCLQVY